MRNFKLRLNFTTFVVEKLEFNYDSTFLSIFFNPTTQAPIPKDIIKANLNDNIAKSCLEITF